MCLIQMGTLTQDEQLETIRIWGEQVIPHFRALDAVEAAADELTQSRPERARSLQARACRS